MGGGEGGAAAGGQVGDVEGVALSEEVGGPAGAVVGGLEPVLWGEELVVGLVDDWRGEIGLYGLYKRGEGCCCVLDEYCIQHSI